jgi:hypothetical protein
VHAVNQPIDRLYEAVSWTCLDSFEPALAAVPGWSGNVYRRPLQDMVWSWRRPLRHAQLEAMIDEVRTLQILGGIAVGVSLIAFALFDSSL